MPLRALSVALPSLAWPVAVARKTALISPTITTGVAQGLSLTQALIPVRAPRRPPRPLRLSSAIGRNTATRSPLLSKMKIGVRTGKCRLSASTRLTQQRAPRRPKRVSLRVPLKRTGYQRHRQVRQPRRRTEIRLDHPKRVPHRRTTPPLPGRVTGRPDRLRAKGRGPQQRRVAPPPPLIRPSKVAPRDLRRQTRPPAPLPHRPLKVGPKAKPSTAAYAHPAWPRPPQSAP